MAAEHRALESELFEVAHRLSEVRLGDADFTFSVLRRRLLDHMAFEEEKLFSAIPTDEVAVLAREHDEIRALLDSTSAALAAQDRLGALGRLGRLAARLGEHSDREDALLYPRVDATSGVVDK